MKQKISLMIIPAALYIIFFTVCGHAFEYQFGAEVFEGLFKEDNFLDEDSGTFDYDETYNILGLYPEGYVDFGGNISGYALGELEWFHSWDAEDKNDLDGQLTDVFLSYYASGFSVDVGLQPFVVGKGVVTYSDEPGIAFRYDGWTDTYINGDVFRIFGNSPMVKMAFGYMPGFLETVEIIGAWYHDADDRIAELFEPFYEDADLESSGHLFWIGGQADFFVRDVYVSCLMMQQFGSVEIDDGAGGLDLDVSAYLIDLELNYNISRQLSAAAFVFTASGDHSPKMGNLNAFMSPMPFNQRTVIFFNGGFERYDIEEAILLGGVTWDGVIAPGVKFEYHPNLKIITELVAAMMFPEGDLFDTDTWYGWEADTRLSYEFYQNHKLFVEAGIFTHGNFFKQKYGFRPDPATRVVAGMSLIF
ncbi:MAG: hypothetical protein HF978_03615 [Desulfobacteraceae bacterium]|nr:hypothetical protein [Desulfobacteraceae bacterium]MBC2754614.1 hypothetical protein [Desulfobacteraceae bacterium]